MNEISTNSQRRFRMSRIFWIGGALLAAGISPLLLVIISADLGIGDPNPNPIGFGMLAFVTFWPSIVLMVAGLIVSVVRWQTNSPGPAPPTTKQDAAKEPAPTP